MINLNQHYTKLISIYFICVLGFTSCSLKNENNMKWTAKYNFIDLYKTKVNKGLFNPGSAITIWTYSIPSENQIIIGAEKNLSNFNESSKSGSKAVIFLSNNRGKSYKEVEIEGQKITITQGDSHFTLIQSNSNGYGPEGRDYISILNNNTLQVKKIDEYNTGESKMQVITYHDFDGKYAIKSSSNKAKLINLLDKEEFYDIPVEITKNNMQFYNMGNREILYLKENEIIKFNCKTNAQSTIKKLKDNYSYFFKEMDQLLLYKTIEEKGDNYKYAVYDLEENFLYEKTEKDNEVYRYQNFACDYSKLGPQPLIRYSFDFRKTWKTCNVRDFSILQSRVGFYKDQFLVTEGIFFHGDSPESGGRIMVGEFVK